MKCPDCGLGYVPDVFEDTRFHKKYHDEIVNGLPAKRAKNDRIIWEDSPLRITLVNYNSPLSQKKRAEMVAIIARKDTPFDFASYHASEPFDDRNVHVFLLYLHNRIIGLTVIEKRSNIWKCTWKQYESREPEILTSHPSIWSIGFVWIHRRYRRKGLARQIVKEAASFLATDMQSIGWYTGFTESGEALIRRLCPDHFYIAR